eukprot:347697-Chlamydomonas_euryale.AAC.1
MCSGFSQNSSIHTRGAGLLSLCERGKARQKQGCVTANFLTTAELRLLLCWPSQVHAAGACGMSQCDMHAPSRDRHACHGPQETGSRPACYGPQETGSRPCRGHL